MKNLSIKLFLIFFIFILYAPYVWAQDYENQEQIEIEIEIDTLQLYIKNAQYRQAIEFINSMEPTKDLLYQKALCFRYMSNHISAIEILTDLSEEYPDDIPIILQLANCYEAMSKYAKSIDCYDNLLRIDSTNTYFEVRKADLFFKAEKYNLALEAYNKIDTSYNPNYISRCIAMCYEKLNQQENAKQYFNKAWDLNELDVYSANSLVKIHVKEENYLSAYENSEKYIRIDSTDATMNALNAYVYYNMDLYDIAIERFEKSLQQGDSSVLVNRSLGFCYYLTDKDSLAHPLLQQALLQDTTNTNVLYILGKVCNRLGYYQEAIECFKTLLETITPSTILLFNSNKELAFAYEKTESFNKAFQYYQTALGLTQDNNFRMELFFSLATIADKELKYYPSAINYYTQYHTTLLNYQGSLTDEQEINEIESKLTALGEYIKLLKEKEEQRIKLLKEEAEKRMKLLMEEVEKIK